jgi:hypothetical protein
MRRRQARSRGWVLMAAEWGDLACVRGAHVLELFIAAGGSAALELEHALSPLDLVSDLLLLGQGLL